ncbi:MAG: divalent-cation tolerance protein CutA [Verrucomicrobiales bacterium]|jgi:periplasmic divalent cation tolerance protein|nr:divalent-cation tolerance protein CutA [Verrucomicrobiales bacterium]
MSEAMIIFCTVPDADSGRRLADVLLSEKAAACVSLSAAVESHYVWQGKRETAAEVQLLIKTTAERYADVQRLILANHPYECPEIAAVSVEEISPAYLAWLKTDGQPPQG